MLKAVNLSRGLKREWLDYTLSLVEAKKPNSEIKELLNSYLERYIKSSINVRKTRELLLKTWVNTDISPSFVEQCVKLYSKNPESSFVLHWCMLCLNYPIFKDVAGIIGKSDTIQDTFNLKWLKTNLYDEWGERVTLDYSLDKIIQTMKSLGTIMPISSGNYAVNHHDISNPELIKIVIQTVVMLKLTAYYEISDLSTIPCMFPMSYLATIELIHDIPDLQYANIGSKLVIVP